MKITTCLAMTFLIIIAPRAIYAQEINVHKLADAIYQAEGGNKTKHPYGILKKYKHTTPRQACINTIKSNLKKFNNQTKEKDFVVFLGQIYCPVNAANDPTGLNKNWVKNVKHFYNKTTKEQ